MVGIINILSSVVVRGSETFKILTSHTCNISTPLVPDLDPLLKRFLRSKDLRPDFRSEVSRMFSRKGDVAPSCTRSV